MPNTSPIFILTANRGNDGSANFGARLTAANTTRDLSITGSASQIFVAGASGSRVENVTFTHEAAVQTQASVACVGRIFITGTAAANPRLISEIALPLTTPSTTAIGGQQVITFSPPLLMPTGSYLWASISVTQTSGGYDVTVSGGDY